MARDVVVPPSGGLPDRRQAPSLRATTGFLKRAESGNLRFVDGFLDDIRAHADIMRQREKLVAA
ncbi:hypothetical protein [Cellulomonas sp. ATA003]|uniref:hypothetical protein n=1 Tax=Cellulomonas sp. ATA003 TaxID=3073064 RepID=UPI002872FA51|nr:hypothetical protein [Cellulomonas sp. ATA003]WNB86451.1 hypothetical protein REH70_04220 [Cellulomonas sp. ATA003]